MRGNVCEEDDPPIKQLIMENYVPWYCNVYSSSEYQYYDSGKYIPVICRIDPRNPQECIDKTIGLPDKVTFYNRLLEGLGDIDSDGMPDEWERLHDLDALFDDSTDDLDRDDLSNINEYTSGTYPNNADSDSDGMPDGWEVQYGFGPLANDSSGDPDKDGLINISEYTAGTHPNDPDSDGDGMPDGWEAQYGLNPLVNDANADLDNDGFSNLKEYKEGTLPNDRTSRPRRGMPWLQLLLDY